MEEKEKEKKKKGEKLAQLCFLKARDFMKVSRLFCVIEPSRNVLEITVPIYREYLIYTIIYILI